MQTSCGAEEPPRDGLGTANFLAGAGCSLSAKIPLAWEVTRNAIVELEGLPRAEPRGRPAFVDLGNKIFVHTGNDRNAVRASLLLIASRYLHGKRALDAAVINGMGTWRRYELARHLAKLVSTTNCQVIVERADHASRSTIEDAFAWIEQSLAIGRPVLIALMEGMDHYTVVAGSTGKKTLQLFDSTGMRFVRKGNCGLGTGFHHVPPNGLLRIAVHRST